MTEFPKQPVLIKYATFALSLLMAPLASAQTVTQGANYLEYGIGRFEYPAGWQVTSSAPNLSDDGGFAFGMIQGAQTIMGSFDSSGANNAPSIESNVLATFELISANTAYDNLKYEYFETSNGFTAGIVYYEIPLAGSKMAMVFFDLTLNTDGNNYISADLTLTGSSIDQAMAIADGVMRATNGTPTPNQSILELQSSAPFESAQTVTQGTNYLEYGIGRFEYPAGWQVTSSAPNLSDDGGFAFGMIQGAQTIMGSFDSSGANNAPSIELSVLAAFESFSANIVYDNVTYQYFETSNGFPAGIVYYEIPLASSKMAMVFFDLTLNTDGNNYISADLTLTGSSIDQAMTIADGMMRPTGQSTSSATSSETNAGNNANEGNSGENGNLPMEIIMECNFQDGPLSLCLPKNTTIDFVQAYAENGLTTMAHYNPFLEGAYMFSPMIFLQTESIYDSLEAWAAHQCFSWKSSEWNATITSVSFTTDRGFPATYIIREYNSTSRDNNFEYFIVVDLTTDAWKQRYAANQYASDNAWLKLQLTGSGQSASQNNFEEAMAIAMSVHYDQSVVPDIPQFAEKESFSFNTLSGGREFTDGPVSFDLYKSTTIDFVQSYAENGLMTMAHYYPYFDGSFMSPMIFLHTESIYNSLDDWAAHQSHSWEASQFNTTIYSQSFTTDRGLPAKYIIREYNSTIRNNNFEYFIVVDLTTDAWKQRYSANPYASDNAWLKLQLTGFGQSTSQNNFEEAMAIAMSVDYDQSVIPNIPQFADKGAFSFNTFSGGREFTDGPVSFDLNKSTTIDFVQSYAENGLMTMAHYYPYFDGSFMSPMIFLQTDSLYNSLDDWAALQSHSWNASEFNTAIYSKSFTTDRGFPAKYIIREYNSTVRDNNFEYFIVVDLTTDAWKQRYSANPYASDNAWLKLQLTGFGQSASQNNFEEAMAIAMSADYDQSVIPDIPECTPTEPFNFEKQISDKIILISSGPNSIVEQSGDEYSWGLDLDGITIWSTSPDLDYERFKYEFNEDTVVRSTINQWDDKKTEEVVELVYSISGDGILFIQGTDQDDIYLNLVGVDEGIISSKYASTKQEAEHKDFTDFSHTLALNDGKIRTLEISNNGEEPDTFSIVDDSGNNLKRFSLIGELIDYLEKQDDNATFSHWVESVNAPVITILQTHINENNNTRLFFTDEGTARTEFEDMVYEDISLGPLSFEAFSGTTVNNRVPFSTNGSSSYTISTPLSKTHSLVYPNLHTDYVSELWVKDFEGLALKRLNAMHSKGSGSNAMNVDRNVSNENDLPVIALTRTYNHEVSGTQRLDYSILIDLNHTYPDEDGSLWLYAELSQEGESVENSSFESALNIARSFDFNTTWTPPIQDLDDFIQENEITDIFDPVPIYHDSVSPPFKVTSIDPSSNWYNSSWFGDFFQSPSGWIYHLDFGWLYPTDTNLTESCWMYGEDFGWIWIDSYYFPIFYSDVRTDWVYFFKETYPAFYDYHNQVWTTLSSPISEEEIVEKNSLNYDSWLSSKEEEYRSEVMDWLDANW